jgi:hypothetical protein
MDDESVEQVICDLLNDCSTLERLQKPGGYRRNSPCGSQQVPADGTCAVGVSAVSVSSAQNAPWRTYPRLFHCSAHPSYVTARLRGG